MTIEKNLNGTELNITITGRLDTTTAPEFESFLSENFNGTGALVIDCEKLVYVSSAGI